MMPHPSACRLELRAQLGAAILLLASACASGEPEAAGVSDSPAAGKSGAAPASLGNGGRSGGSGAGGGPASVGAGGGSGPGSTGTGGAGGGGGSVAAAGRGGGAPSASPDAGARTDAGAPATDGSSAVPMPPILPPGRPGCGLPSAAFCDTFEAPSPNRGRAGELDASRWSAGRLAGGPTDNGAAMNIGRATIPFCRAGVPAQVLPDDDALICPASADVGSSHLLVATAAQNYGQNSYRIRQPFDFAGRTGKIVFDAEAFILTSLLGWVSIAVTEDPMSVPSFAQQGNYEGGILPRNGFTIEFDRNCGAAGSGVGFGLLNVYKDYKVTVLTAPRMVCLPVKEGKLHHFEVTVSQSRIEIFGTGFSPDGVKFDAPKLLHAADVDLPFSRGYVSISVHNHATKKYSEGTGRVYDAWVARWDNVGFDGPGVGGWREHEVPDAMVPFRNGMNVGYRVADVSKGPNGALRLRGVNLDGVTSARLAFSGWYPPTYTSPAGYDKYLFKYRINGGAWKDRLLTAGEIGVLNSGKNWGGVAQMIDVAPGELLAGDNTLEFVSQNIGQGYPPMVTNVDLVLSTR